MTVRRARPEDLDRIAEIYEEAKKAIAVLGIDQWQDGYPNRSVAEEDCAAGLSVVVCEGDLPSGVCVLIPDGEKTYDVIENGAWLTGNGSRKYMTVHRIAVLAAFRGKGAAARLLHYAEEEARGKGLSSIRIDTHEGNVVMRRMLEKNGFVYCGVIHLENGDPRVAYENRISDSYGGIS